MPVRARTVLLAFLVVASLWSAACAGAGSGSSDRGRPNLITAEELAGLEVSDAYEAIRQLRPRWLRSRDAREPVQVVVDGARRGDVSELRLLPVSGVRQIRYRDGRDATTRYGVGYGSGVIEVTTR